MGKCKLWWIKSDKSPSLKNPSKWKKKHYNEKKTLEINVEWALYGIIQLTKSICKVAHLENSLSCMLKGKRY